MQQYPMTSMQKAYYIGRQISDISTKVMFSVITEKDLPRLEKALNRVIQEQPALRTVFTDTYEQRILEETPDYHISVQDIREMSKQEQEQYLDTLFDTRKGINILQHSNAFYHVHIFGQFFYFEIVYDK